MIQINKDQIKQDFIGFLKRHKAYKRYMRNVDPKDNTIPPGRKTSGGLDGLLSRNVDIDLVWSAFSFSRAPEGTTYWAKLASKWEKYAEKNYCDWVKIQGL